MAHYDIGTLVDCYDPQFLSETIRQMAGRKKNDAGFAAANAELTWENESKVLLKILV